MSLNKVYMNFNNTFEGDIITPSFKIPVGNGDGRVLPYDMIFGALGSCMYVNFQEIADKQKIKFESVTVEVTGDKRDTIPRLLEWVLVKYIVKNCDNKEGLRKASKLSSKYCSIYQTLDSVAKMSCVIEFIDNF